MSNIVLHIEDNEGDAFLIERGFRKYPDVELVQFERAEKALEWLADHEAKLILVDWFLPDMEGDEFVSRLREGGLVKDASIVLLTGQTPPNTEGLEDVSIEVKPHSLTRLRELIEQWNRFYVFDAEDTVGQ